MTKTICRKYLVMAGLVVLTLPFSMQVYADDSGVEHEHNMYEDAQNKEDFNETLEEQQNNVMQQLEELKAKTQVTYKPIVPQEDAPYFKPPKAELDAQTPPPEPEHSYVYKKKSKTAAPSRSFNNVR